MENTRTARLEDTQDLDRLWERGKAVLISLGYAGMGFLLSGAQLFGVYVPLGAAFCAACEGRFAVFACIGAILGGFLRLSGASLVRCAAVCAGAAAASLITERAGFAARRRIILTVTVGACCFVSASAVLITGGAGARDFLAYICDSALSAGAVAVYIRSISSVRNRTEISQLDKRSLVCIILSLCTVLLSVSRINIIGIHPARIVGALAMLLAAYLFAEPGGSIAGICIGTCVAASGTGGVLSACWGAGGLAAGIFASYGRLAAAAAFSVTAFIAAVIDSSGQGIAVLAETGASAVLFMLIPHERLGRLKSRLDLQQRAFAAADSGCERLLDASQAIGSVARCIRTVSQGIDSITPARDRLLRLRIYESVCSSCPKSSEDCLDKANLGGFAAMLSGGKELTCADFSAEFLELCPQSAKVAKACNRAYACRPAASAVSAAQARAREAACGQFESVSAMLAELSNAQLARCAVLSEKEKTAVRVLADSGLAVDTVCCTRPPQSALRLEARVREILPGTSVSSLTKRLGRELGVTLNPPEVSPCESGAKLVFDGVERYAVRFGSAVSACGGEKLCGDYFECFRDEAKAYIMLSDGMGTGGRAAVDSAMTVELFSRLVRAGVTMKTALAITGSALNVKSCDESLSTLDVARIDLFTGETLLCKAGAAASFVRCAGKVKTFMPASSPLGILEHTQFAQSHLVLHGGDTLLMVSDGILGCGHEWLVRETELFDGSDASGFAQYILECAKRKCGSRYDDMTVLAAVIENI